MAKKRETLDLEPRSGCPINLATEVLGDRWSLIVIRDMMFGSRRHYRELLNGSMEGIASNILAARLKRLCELGLVSAAPDPTHKQKVVYSLTERAIDLVPVFVALGAWGCKHLPTTPALAARAQFLEAGGPKLWRAFTEELRFIHLGSKKPRRRSVLQELGKAYEVASTKG